MSAENSGVRSRIVTSSSRQTPGQVSDPLGLQQHLRSYFSDLARHPFEQSLAPVNFAMDVGLLWQRTWLRAAGFATEPVIEAVAGDRRFKYPAWQEELPFDAIKQFYLLFSRHAVALFRDRGTLDQRTRQTLAFACQQVVDALSPSNFAATNPEVAHTALESIW